MTMKKGTSEFRKDLISGEWILIAPGRARRPEEFRKGTVRVRTPLSKCPFEHPYESVDEHVILQYSKRGAQIPRGEERRGDDWSILVLQNKYPAVQHAPRRPVLHTGGLFETMEGVGHHDLLITRDHDRNLPELSPAGAFRVLQAFRNRYLMLFEERPRSMAYVSMFQNYGPRAGGSVYHPHYQIVAIPVLPPDVARSLEGSARYFHAKGKCPHCAMLQWERRQKKRVIFETEHAVALAPFVSHNAFEVRIFPKRHSPYFEDAGDGELADIAQALREALRRIRKNLGDPDYNFFIHTAPMERRESYRHYHWHIEIYPFFNIHAGFEMETGLIINPVDPDLAAKILRR